MKLSLKDYHSASTQDQRMQMRPLFRANSTVSKFTPPAEVPKSVNIYFELSPCSSSNICFGDARIFSGHQQFHTSYSKNYSVYTPRDYLYTSPCQSHKSTRPAALSPVQDLMFRFAQKIAASKVDVGGKSSLRRAFESFDTNGDRCITKDELQAAVARLGFDAAEGVSTTAKIESQVQ